MTRDPLSDALRDAAVRHEAAYSKAGAHADPGLASRARRRRLGAIAVVSTLSLGLVAASGAAAAYVLQHDRGLTADPIAPPIPDGYERVVVPVPDDNGWVAVDNDWDPVLEASGLYGDCGVPIADLGDSGPFSLEITSVALFAGPTMSADDGSPVTDIEATALLSYDGKASGAVHIGINVWAILRDDGTVVQVGVGPMLMDPDYWQGASHPLAEPFSTEVMGWIPTVDCAKVINDPGLAPFPTKREWLLDPGSYSMVAVVKVSWSPAATVVFDGESLGLDPAWFGAGWRDAVPCSDAIAEARRTQNGNAVECAPHLYYQQMFGLASNNDYAIVDVPDGFLSGPRKTWYVVSDPYPFEWPDEW